MNKLYYFLLIVLSAFLCLLMDIGIPIIIASFYSIITGASFSWILVVFLYIIIKTFKEVKNVADILIANWSNKNGN